MTDEDTIPTADPLPAAASADPSAAPDEYAIVEIFGRRRHVGRVREVERFGAKLLCVDVPADGDFAAGYTSHLYGGAAIFSFTATDLDTVVRSNRPRPALGAYRLPPPGDDDDAGDPADEFD